MIGSTNKIPTVRGLSTLVRPRFGPGMLLQHDDLDLLTDYTRELNRLLFRSLFGCGVICGLEVNYKENCGQHTITVDAGVGLVCSGDPVYVPRQQTVILDENCADITDTELWVVLCGTSKACSPRPSMCATDDEEIGSSATRERDGFEIRVVGARPKCACFCEPPLTKKGATLKETTTTADGAANTQDGIRTETCWCVNPEDPCYKDHYEGICGCACEGGDGCCDCIVLVRLLKQKDGDIEWWKADHSVRRFIRPVLMRDPALRHDKTRSKRYSQTADEQTVSAAGAAAAKRRKGPPHE
jgi:hypothetical protein